MSKQHLADVRALGCLICGGIAEAHHIRELGSAGKKAPDEAAIPLCAGHHRTGGYGVAYHAGEKAFEANFGTEMELLAETRKRLAWIKKNTIG